MSLNKVLSFSIIAVVIGFIAAASYADGEVKKPGQAGDKVATVNGEVISRGEFEGEVLKIQKALLEYGKPLTPKQAASVQKEVLEGMVRREVLYQESRKSGVKADDDAINKELKALRQQFQTETDFKNELSKKNISEDILRSRLQKNSAIQQYVERQVAPKIKVEDKDVVAYYEGRPEIFRQPLQVRVSHILIQADPKWERGRRQDARKKAEQIVKDLKKGKDFAAIAREQSDGLARTNDGDMGYIKTGQLEKQFEDAVFALKPGETTSIIETDNGFHLFKVTDKKPETALTYEDVKDKIRQFLIEEKAKQEADLQARTLREKADVKIFLSEDSVFK